MKQDITQLVPGMAHAFEPQRNQVRLALGT